MMGQSVEYKGADDAEVRGVLVLPENSPEEGPWPGVILIHEVFGLDDHMRSLAQRLANEGFAVLVPDLYSRQEFPGPSATPKQPVPTWTGDQIRGAVAGLSHRQVLGDLERGLELLGKHPEVQTKALAAMGFCMGGNFAFLLGCHSSRLQAVVDFYGRIVYSELDANRPSQPLEMALNLSPPVLGLFGAEDASIPAEHVQLMREKLDQFAKRCELHSFAGAGHGFFNETRPGYHAESAAEAWRLCLEFLREELE